MKVALCLPTLNAAREWTAFRAALEEQSLRPQRVLVIDSESGDGTAELAERAGCEVVRIVRSDFGHGRTRQLAATLCADCELLIYMTQDAVLASGGALERLVAVFADPAVGAAYGRQLPRPGAGWVEAHARWFNYPARSEVRELRSSAERGLKAVFFSNSFGAYRQEALAAVGGFPRDANFGEDTLVAGRMLLAGWKLAYVAEAEVYHSHAYGVGEEFIRHCAIGELHGREGWLLENFGSATGEGMRFVRSQLMLLARGAPWLIPGAVARLAAKYAGYRVGLRRGSRRQ